MPRSKEAWEAALATPGADWSFEGADVEVRANADTGNPELHLLFLQGSPSTRLVGVDIHTRLHWHGDIVIPLEGLCADYEDCYYAGEEEEGA